MWQLSPNMIDVGASYKIIFKKQVNKDKNIKKFKQLISKYDFYTNKKIIDENINQIILFVLKNNERLQLSNNEIFELIQKSYLNVRFREYCGIETEIFPNILLNNNLKLSKDQLMFFYKQLGYEQKLITFIMILRDRQKNKEEINFLLYDCQLQIDREAEKEIFNYYYHHYNEIMKMIKERDFFLDLQKNLPNKQLKNKTKI